MPESALKGVGICSEITVGTKHATAAIADFHCMGQGWMWNRRIGARFRIPQYDGHLCLDLDLPIATDDVIEEARPRPQLKPSPMPPMPPPPLPVAVSHNNNDSNNKINSNNNSNHGNGARLYRPQSRKVHSIRLEMFPLPPTRKPTLPMKGAYKNPNRLDQRSEIGEKGKKTTPIIVRLAKEDQQP